MMHIIYRLFKIISWFTVSVLSALSLGALGVYLYLTPTLPNTDTLKDVKLQTPLRIYTQKGELISEFGEKRRRPIKIEDVPKQFIDALLAAEDSNFFSHNGIDYKGLTRAVIQLITTGKKKGGGGTISMQVARNYYLTREKTFRRKFTEILLTLKIEDILTKQEILELYINKVFLGKRAYGFESAAYVYYGKSLNELDLAQLAMLAGLPQAPSTANPINNPKSAINRRNYVLARMRTLDKISLDEFERAAVEPVTASYHTLTPEVNAPFVAEMVRQQMLETYGDDIYTEGYQVFTTIDAQRQHAANRALQSGLLNYSRDHGFIAQSQLILPTTPIPEDPATQPQEQERNSDVPSTIPDSQLEGVDWQATLKDWQKALLKLPSVGIISPTVVASIRDETMTRAYTYETPTPDDTDKPAQVLDPGVWLFQDNRLVWMPFTAMQWAKPRLSIDSVGKEPEKPSDIVAIGQVVWVEQTAEGPKLAQKPKVQGAIVSIDPNDGALQALSGGFAFNMNKFNHVTQAERQPGSVFKPFIYSAALDRGMTPATLINDAPVVFDDNELENTWRPENHSGKFYGPTRLRQALYKSQNLVSIRVLKRIKPRNVIRFVEPFGFDGQKLNNDLSLALGASAVTPWQIAQSYSVFANGGYRIDPYLIEQVRLDEQIIHQATPDTACLSCVKRKTPVAVQASQPDSIESAEQLQSYLDQLKAQAAEPIQQMRPQAKRVMDARVNYLITSMMQDVIRRGTGKRAMALERTDLAGKTGTTNDQKDGWFSGFGGGLVTTVWVGFDEFKTLGRWAFGGTTALPIWDDYMREALDGVPEQQPKRPAGIVSVRIDPATGDLAYPGQPEAIFEIFREENVPTKRAQAPQTTQDQQGQTGSNGTRSDDPIFTPEQLF